MRYKRHKRRSNAVGKVFPSRCYGVCTALASEKGRRFLWTCSKQTPSLNVLIRAPRRCREKFINAPVALRSRSEIVVQTPRRCYGVHGDLKCVYTALIWRVNGVFTACHLSYCASVAFARRFHGVHGARVELLLRLQGVFTAFIALAWSFFCVQWPFMIQTQNR